jgi:hypothetical protein
MGLQAFPWKFGESLRDYDDMKFIYKLIYLLWTDTQVARVVFVVILPWEHQRNPRVGCTEAPKDFEPGSGAAAKDKAR